MPSVPQYDWSKLMPKQPAKRQTHGTKDFATFTIKDAPKNSKHGHVKIIKPPKNKRVKAQDKTIWRDNYDNSQHLAQIYNE